MDIWMMRKDGSHLRQLTSDPAHDWAPKWSPDGKRIIFYSLRSGNRDIFIKPVAGGATLQFTKDPADDRYPAWSPDGKRIVFPSDRSGNADLWMKPLEDGYPQQITSDDSWESFPLWHPDGQRIVFTSNRTGSHELYIRHIDGGESVQLTDGDWSIIYAFSWSRDGNTIYAYGRESVGIDLELTLWAISVRYGSARKMVDFNDESTFPSFSLATDHVRIYFPMIELSSDIWLGELAWE
jgi:TolB protein